MASKLQLEALLTQRGLGRTLPGSGEPAAPVPPRLELRPGTILELVPEPDGGGGVTSLGLELAAGCAGKLAWLDPDDRLDPAGAASAGVALERLLWLRGGDVAQALQAAQLLVQAGGFGLLALDLLEQPGHELAVPRATWFRLLRGLERERRTALLLLAPRPLTGSCADQVWAARQSARRWDAAGRPLLQGARIELRRLAGRRTGGGQSSQQGREYWA